MRANTYLIKKPGLKKSLLNPNPVLPLLYVLPKVHKQDVPMRPVISFVSSPAYLVAFVDWWLKSHVDFESPHSVRNSMSLVDSIKDIIRPRRTILCSFDVVGLFPNIPKAVTIQRSGELLVNSNIPHEEVVVFLNLLKICWSPNFCKFKGEFRYPHRVSSWLPHF